MQSSMRPPLTTSTGSTVSPCLARSIRRKTISKGKLEARSRAHADDDDTESLDGDEDADEEEDEMEEVERRDEDGYRSSHAAQHSGKGDMGIGQRQKRQDGQHRHDAHVNLLNDDTLESDLSIILGMASDMELVMPKFDDAYLADLDDNQPGSSWKRASRQSVKGGHAATLQPLNNVEPPCSQSSSSTITSIPTMRSRTASPCVDPSGRSTSLPSPHTALTTSTSQSSPAMMYNSKLEESADKSCDSMISATTISRDIDNLKRHRDSLKEVEEKINESNDNFSATRSTKSSGPIYFKPPTHTIPTNSTNSTAAAPLRSLPTMASNGTPPRPAPMIIQSTVECCPPSGLVAILFTQSEMQLLVTVEMAALTYQDQQAWSQAGFLSQLA
ncbi:hypothetical protein BGW42_008043 [Actinomortierella wolfii]|nr:hypothetical protein BGW42_008043 [Actinomortierella wolfii]